MPGSGLRLRRRVWESCAVLVDGAPRGAAFRVRRGQRLDVRPLAGAGNGDACAGPDSGAPVSGAPVPAPDPAALRAPVCTEVRAQVRVVAETAEFGALYKPGGLHSARVAGSPAPCAEELLEPLWPGRAARLCNRLDRETSGLLLAAFSPEALARFRGLENRGAVEKLYLAVVSAPGAPPAVPFDIDRALDTANRRKTRVLREASPDPLRRTRVLAAAPGPLPGTLLLRVVIAKGARHQIRAHLAHAGLPIVGESLYADALHGDPLHGDAAAAAPANAAPLHLHHARIAFAGFAAECPPPWPTTPDAP
jgi:23S rRNA pseudouridine1911/1915/1917 synthase